jgi:Tfp pilus assembly protein PilO
MTSKPLLEDLRYCAKHPLVRIGIWVGAVVAAITILAFVFWWPAQGAYSKINDQIADKRRELVTAQQADALLQEYAKAKQDVPLLEKKLEHAVSQAQLVENLTRLARRHSARIVNETYEETKTNAGQPMLMAELTIQGSYTELRGFLRDLPSLPTWSEVQEVRLEGARGTSEIKGKIRLATYRRTMVTERTGS